MPILDFQPETDGFLFENLFHWDDQDRKILADYLKDAVDLQDKWSLGALEQALSLVLLPALLFGGPIYAIAVRNAVRDWIAGQTADLFSFLSTSLDGGFGLCGGMAFTSLDYWMKSWTVPQGIGQHDQPPHGASGAPSTVLRDYIWNRLLTSLTDNGATFFVWGVVSQIQRIITYSDLPINSNPAGAWLRDQTKSHLAALKSSIDHGVPVVLGLVLDPLHIFDSHQVICYGYEDQADGTTMLSLYDPNLPNQETSLSLDLSGDALKIPIDGTKAADRPGRADWVGVFVMKYNPADPPKAIVLSQGLSFPDGPGGDVDQPIPVSYAVKNVGYHRTRTLRLLLFEGVSSEPFSESDAQAGSLEEGESRPLSTNLMYDQPLVYQVSVPAVEIDNDNKVRLTTKVLPPERGQQASASVEVFLPLTILWVRRERCEPLGVAGRTSVFRVDTSDMDSDIWVQMGIRIQWSVSARAGDADQPIDVSYTVQNIDGGVSHQCIVDWPSQVGASVTITVTATKPDGAASIGTTEVTVISQGIARLQETICELGFNPIFQEQVKIQIPLPIPKGWLPGSPPGTSGRYGPGDLSDLRRRLSDLEDAVRAASIPKAIEANASFRASGRRDGKKGGT